VSNACKVLPLAASTFNVFRPQVEPIHKAPFPSVMPLP
jgi:hypothetical protein